MTRFSLVALASGLAAWTPMDGYACAGCRNPNIPITKVDAAGLSPGELRTGLSIAAMGLEITHDAGCRDLTNCREIPVQPLYRHHQTLYSGELRAVLEYGLTSKWGIETQFPFRSVLATIEYTDPRNQPYVPLDPDIHHRDETLVGFGDPWLLMRYAWFWNGVAISTRAGLTLPLGKTEPNPYELGESGLKHQHIQFGSGTVEPLLLLDISKFWGAWMVTGYFQGQAGLVENTHGFQSATKVSGGVQAGHKVWRSLSGSLGAEVFHEEPETWDGMVQQDGNLGRTELLASLTLIQSFKSIKVGFSLRVPFYQHIVPGDEDPGTLSTPVMVGVFLNHSLRFQPLLN
jgi:hypothetical protein